MADTTITTDPLNIFGRGIWETLTQTRFFNQLRKIEWSSEGSWESEGETIPLTTNIRKRKLLLD